MFCATCRGEFRAGIVRCPTCDVALVDALPETENVVLGDDTVAVGVSGENAAQRVAEVDGRTIDLLKAFPYDVASELLRDLEGAHIAAVLRPLSRLPLRDPRPHFEVHVRPEDQARAVGVLHAKWLKNAAQEQGAAVGAVDAEHCPACGAGVPLDVKECPDCGLTVGIAVEEDEADEEDEAAAP